MDAYSTRGVKTRHFDILFETDRFNVSQVKAHFINPCCFGEDLAEWLRQELIQKSLTAGEIGQEDWGWYLFVQQGSERFFVGIGGYHLAGSMVANDGEWRVMVEKSRSIWDRLRGRKRITDTDPILSIIEDILREQRDVRNVRREPL